MEIRITRARNVFTDGKHNAFTGIAAARGQIFIAFRSGPDHGSVIKDTIKVLASTDAENWGLMAEPHSNEALLAIDPAHAEHSTPADIFLAEISYAPA